MKPNITVPPALMFRHVLLLIYKIVLMFVVQLKMVKALTALPVHCITNFPLFILQDTEI